MGWREFIADILSSLAWPVVAIAFLAIFRSEISRVIQRLAHLKYKDFELDFEKVKQHAEELKGELLREPAGRRSPVVDSLEEQILDVVERAPSAAIMLAWSGLETAMASAVGRLAISPEEPSYRSSMHNIHMLSKYGNIPNSYTELLTEMRMLRNKVAHQHNTLVSITQEQALYFANAAIDLIRFFEGMRRGD